MKNIVCHYTLHTYVRESVDGQMRWVEKKSDKAVKFNTINEAENYISKLKQSVSDVWFEDLFLFEDKATDYVKKMIRQNCASYFSQHLDKKMTELPENLQDHLNEYNPTLYEKCLANDTNLMMFLRLDFLQYFDIRRDKGPIKYTIGLARIAIGELGFFKNSSNQSDLSLLKQLVLFAHNNEDVEKSLNADLNGMTFDELVESLNKKRKDYNTEQRKHLQGDIKANTTYKVIPIKSKKEAEKYGEYTSWCITHGSYSSYAKGGSRFYFCLAKSFENVPKEQGPGCPLDRYGLSMVSVLIDMDGEPTIVTTRWNHDHDGENNENLKTAEQVQDVLGIPFYETFKPYTKEQLRKMGVVSFDEAKERLENGEDPTNIFKKVKRWHDLLVVSLNGKYNIINKNNKLTSTRWFDLIEVNDHQNEYMRVKRNEKWNFIDINGNLFLEQWCDYVNPFFDGIAGIKINGKWNFITTDKNFLSKTWFDSIENFTKGYAFVHLNGKANIIKEDGNIVSKDWFDEVLDYPYDEINRVELNDKYNIIDKNGKILSKQWFDYIRAFCRNLAVVELNGKYNYINDNGKLLSNQWFDIAKDFSYGYGFPDYGVVEIDGIKYYIDSEGHLDRIKD